MVTTSPNCCLIVLCTRLIPFLSQRLYHGSCTIVVIILFSHGAPTTLTTDYVTA